MQRAAVSTGQLEGPSTGHLARPWPLRRRRQPARLALMPTRLTFALVPLAALALAGCARCGSIFADPCGYAGPGPAPYTQLPVFQRGPAGIATAGPPYRERLWEYPALMPSNCPGTPLATLQAK